MSRMGWLIALLIGVISPALVFGIRRWLLAKRRREAQERQEAQEREEAQRREVERTTAILRQTLARHEAQRREVEGLRVSLERLRRSSERREEPERQEHYLQAGEKTVSELLRRDYIGANELRELDASLQRIAELRLAGRLDEAIDLFERIALPLTTVKFQAYTALGLGQKDTRARELNAVPPGSIAPDNVHFSVTAPSILPSDQASEIHFWMHRDSQRKTVIELAREIQIPAGVDLSIKSAGPYPIEQGSRISVRIKIDGLICRDNHQWMVWTGEIGHSGFVVEVPADASWGTHIGTASIRLNGCQIAKMSFVLNVGRERGESTEIPSTTEQHKSAFASYASEDRAEVVRCVQAMETAYKGLKVFLDVVDIRSGEKWEERLNSEIANADIFYLFWCRHAAASQWVKKEWQLALEKKGMDFIDPVPLEEPKNAPPPPELVEKHFNHPMLSFFKAAGGTH